jgi:hypothetical protein
MTEGETKWKVENKKRKWNQDEAKQNERPGPGHGAPRCVHPRICTGAACRRPPRRAAFAPNKTRGGDEPAREWQPDSLAGTDTHGRRDVDAPAGPRGAARRGRVRASVGKKNTTPTSRPGLAWPWGGRPAAAFVLARRVHVFPTRGACASVGSHGRLANTGWPLAGGLGMQRRARVSMEPRAKPKTHMQSRQEYRTVSKLQNGRGVTVITSRSPVRGIASLFWLSRSPSCCSLRREDCSTHQRAEKSTRSALHGPLVMVENSVRFTEPQLDDRNV